MRKYYLSISVYVLFLLLSASITYAQTISSQKGLTTAVFTTSSGNIKVYLPDDVRPNDLISGRVIAEPIGKNAKQTANNLTELKKYSISINNEKFAVENTNKPFQFLVNAERTMKGKLELINGSGKKEGELSIPAIPEKNQQPTPAQCKIPSHGLTGSPFRITGPFDGNSSNTNCTLDNKPMEVLAKSPRECIVLYPADATGIKTLIIQESGKQLCLQQVSGVQMNVSAGKLNMLKGEETYINVSITGLQHLPGQAMLTLNNMTTGVVVMLPYNSIVIPISPDSIGSGTFNKTFDIQSIRTGTFSVNVNLDLPENLYDEPPPTQLQPGDKPPTQPQPGDNPQPKDTTGAPTQPHDSTTTVALCPKCNCSCVAEIIFEGKGGDTLTYRVKVTAACTGFFGIPPGQPPCHPCAIIDVITNEWKVTHSADKPIEIIGGHTGVFFKVKNSHDGALGIYVTAFVTCNDGSECKGADSEVYLPTSITHPPGSCECHIACKIIKPKTDCGELTYTSVVDAKCYPNNPKIKCKAEKIEYLWFLHYEEKGIAEIIGPANYPSVKVKVYRPGKYTVFLRVIVTCTDGTKCTNYCYLEEKAECEVDFKWCAGTPINVIKYGEYPYSEDLKDMRPGETIALSVFARDYDNLLQYCGCKMETHIHKHDATPDIVIYDWDIKKLGGGTGKLIQQGGAKSNSVLFQIPFCLEDFPAVNKITVTIKNAGEKANDEAVKVEYTITMSLLVTQKGEKGQHEERQIVVNIDSKILNEPTEVPCEESKGPCVYTKHEWKKGQDPVISPAITMTLPPDNYPDNLVLLTIDAEDKDDLVLNCIHDGIIIPKTISGINDGFDIIWSIKKGEGYFLLGDMGNTVSFQHKYGSTNEVIIQCTITDKITEFRFGEKIENNGQFNDLVNPIVLTIKIPPRKKPIAFVGVGNIKHRVIKAMEHRELIGAAENAVKKYEEAGYNVFTDFELTITSVERAYKNYACQAVLLIGHGDEAGLEMFNEKDAFVHSNIRLWVNEKWGCKQLELIKHPSGRELIVLGCSLGKREDQWYHQYFNLEKFYGRKEWVWSSWAYSSIVSYIKKELTPLPPRILTPK